MPEPRWQVAWHSPPSASGWVLLHQRQHFLADDHGCLFPLNWVQQQDLRCLAQHGIGLFDGAPVQVWELAEPELLPGCRWLSLREVMLQHDEQLFRLLGHASQIGQWAREHRFCGACGQAMQLLPGERAMACEPCGLRQYPRLAPSMIVLVTRGDELLLARSPRFVSGMYSTLAGFLEPGESAEDCVRREVQEEVGLSVDNIRYLGSQNWPFPHSLMLGFHADYAGGELCLQEDEIEDARWFAIDQLPTLPAPRSIARFLIEHYLAQRLGHTLPRLD